MAKKLSKILWHDTKVDGAGKPVLPSVATDDKGLNGLLPGELFMHVGKEKVSLWALSLSGEVVEVSGKAGEVDIDLSDYLLKSVWDSVFEIKTDVSGQKYIFGKLPVVTKYGITMYADDGNVDIPQLAEGLPFDQRTIWFNPDTKQIEVIGGTGGGEGGVSNFWDLSGIPSWITNTKPVYNYSEIQNTPDLSGYATTSSLNAVSTKLNDFLEGSDTDTVINKWKELETFLSGLTESDNLATILTGKADKSYVDTNFVTIAGTEDVTGLHNFVNGLKIGGLPITKKQDDVVYLDANLVVRGGITMYAENEVNIPSILDSLPIASNTALGIASFDSTYFSVDNNGMVSLTSAPSSGASTLGELLNVDASIDATANVDMILFKPANSSVWTWKNVNDIVSGGGSSGATGDVLSAIFGSNSANSIYDFYYTGVQGGGGLPSTSPYGSLLTMPYRKAFGNTKPDFSAQIFIPNGDDASPYLFFRTSLGTSWNEWKRVVSLNSKGIADTPIKVYNDGLIVESRSGNSYISYNGINSSVYFGDIGFHEDSGLASIWTSKTGWRPIIYGADYNGNLVVAGGITMYSDQRKKTILSHVELSLKQIADAPLIEHYYNSDQDKTTHVGSIAQYWAGINDWFCKLDNEGFYTMEIQNCALASAISIARHLEKYESKTDKTIRKMKQRIQELEDEVEQLKKN